MEANNLYWILESIELRGYKWMARCGARHFKIDLDSEIHLIIASNGAGKSSLMRQLNPLPIEKKDFYSDGLKKVIFYNGKQRLILTSDYTLAKPHSFLDADTLQEYNPGGTITVQRDLVKEHFGYDSKINDLLLGNTKFTSLSASARREWIYLLNGPQCEYALKYYDAVKKESSAIQSALALEKKRLVTEVERLCSDEYLKSLHDDVEELNLVCTKLSEYRVPQLHSFKSHVDKLIAIQDEVARSFNKYMRAKSEIEDCFEDHLLKKELGQEFIEHIEASKNIIAGYKGQCEHLLEQIENGNKKLDILKSNNSDSLQSLIEARERLKNELKIITDETAFKLDASIDPDEFLSALEAIDSVLYNISIEIPNNEKGEYSSQKLSAAIEERIHLDASVKNIQRNIAVTDADIKHQIKHRDDPDQTCPNCTHRFSNQYTPSKLKKLQETLLNDQELFEVKSKALADLNLYIEQCNAYKRHYIAYKQIFSNKRTLMPLYEELERREIFSKDPQQYATFILEIKSNVSELIRAKKLSIKIEEIEKALTSFKDSDTKLLSDMSKDLEYLNNQYDEKRKLQEKEQQLLNIVQRRYSLYQLCSGLYDQIRALMNKRKLARKDAASVATRTAFNIYLKELQSELGFKTNELNTLMLQRNRVKHIEERINELEIALKDYQAIIDALSPSDGLIAEHLGGFINELIDHVNGFIEPMWTYGLKILPFKLEIEEGININYKFPFSAEGVEDGDDICLGSKSICEVFNTAFMITAMKYLNLKYVPLFLDEFGSGFDAAHSSAVNHLITELCEAKAFPQFFVVSHKYVEYTSMTGARLLVLNPDNIHIPRMDYNRHFEIIA